MAALEIEELLQDARLVVNYAIRAGRLPDDALPKEIEAVEKDKAAGVPLGVSKLLAALNSAIKAIAPLTLVELRAGRSPFAPQNERAATRLQIYLCVLAIALTSLVAYYTQALHTEETALRAIQKIQNAHPLDKLTVVRKMAEYEGVTNKRDSHYDEYHRGIRELRELQEQIEAAYALSVSVSETPMWPFADRLAELWQWFGAPSKKTSADSASAGGNAGTAEPSEATTKGPDVDICSVKNPAPNKGRGVAGEYPAWLESVIADSIDEYCFTAKLSLGVNSFSTGTSGWIYRIQDRMALENGWILPFLYGLLGSVVFLMRSLLNPHVQNVEVYPAILRIALGGVAGIVIGWFWVPTGAHAADVSITSVPFGLAFLAGFSIDILFSLLDRLNKAITDARVGAPPRSK